MPQFIYTAMIDRWVDGDTCEVTVDLGFRVFHAVTVRLLGIDTPERNSTDPEQRAKAVLARKRASEIAPVDHEVTIETSKPDPRDKYGRWLCVMRPARTDLSVADVLIREGLGKPYNGGSRA
jgi:micrococcal nuclease